MELWVLDKELNRLNILENFESLIWTRRYNKAGEFELFIIATDVNLKCLKQGNLLYKKDGTDADECGFINFIQINTQQDGKEMMQIKGKFITAYTGFRIIWGTENINSTYKEAMEHLVNVNCINTSNINRKIPFLQNINNNWIDTQKISYQVSYMNLADELEKLSLASNIGYKIIADIPNKKLHFVTYNGVDRRDTQDKNDKATFSLEFGNILSQQYVHSIDNYTNCTLILGEGEDTKRKSANIGNSYKGMDRIEAYTDARDINITYTVKEIVDGKEVDKEKTYTEAEYLQLLITRGGQKLAETQEVQTFDSIINTVTAGYKTKFDLGDIATCVSKKWGVKADVRITEIQEIFEGNGMRINVTFGNTVPTLIDKVKQRTQK